MEWKSAAQSGDFFSLQYNLQLWRFLVNEIKWFDLNMKQIL